MIETVVVKYKNSSDSLTLTLASPEKSQGFAIVDMSGLGPGKANLNTSDWVTVPGSTINSVRFPKRTITMELRFLPTDYSESISDMRRKSYIYFPLGEEVTLEVYDIDGHGYRRGYAIDGVISMNEPAIWSATEGCSIEITCGFPFFRSVESREYDLELVHGLLHFILPDEATNQPFPMSYRDRKKEWTIDNDSLVAVGFQLYLTSTGTVKNPYIYNSTTNQTMSFEYTMEEGESILIDTRPGHKSVTLQKGVGVNLINTMSILSKWVSLRRGVNVLGINSESGANNLGGKLIVVPLFVGI